jgi:hypothetical protein
MSCHQQEVTELLKHRLAADLEAAFLRILLFRTMKFLLCVAFLALAADADVKPVISLDLLKAAFEFIVQNSEAVFQGEGMRHLPKELLLSMMQGDELDVEEEVVFDAVLEWCEANKGEGGSVREEFAAFLPFIRFAALSHVFLHNRVMPSGLVPTEVVMAAFVAQLDNPVLQHPGKRALEGGEENERSAKRRRRRAGQWRTFAADRVELSEDGAVATQISKGCSLTTTGVELTEGKHYWEVELKKSPTLIGISRPNLDPKGEYLNKNCTDVWFIGTNTGYLYGNGKAYSDAAGACTQGDRVGVLLDLDDGSLSFFKNGVQHDPGYPAGSVTGPVVAAVQLCNPGSEVRYLPNAQQPQ